MMITDMLGSLGGNAFVYLWIGQNIVFLVGVAFAAGRIVQELKNVRDLLQQLLSWQIEHDRESKLFREKDWPDIKERVHRLDSDLQRVESDVKELKEAVWRT